MKKRFTGLFLACIMAIGMCIPASAHATDTNPLTLTPVDDMTEVVVEDIDTSVEVVAEVGNEVTPKNDIRASSTSIRNTSSIRQVVIYPIVYCVDEGVAYILEDIYRSASWPTVNYTDASLKLSPDAVTTFAQEALTTLANNSETSTYTWVVAGWRVESVHDLTASKPRRLEWTPSATCLDGTATQSMTISQQSVRVRIGHNYSIPSDPYSYYYLGISGTFYYIYTSGSNSGQEAGTLMGGGVRMNSSN